MMENGFVKLSRSILKWDWYDDLPTKALYIHLLLTVNIKDSKWHGISVKRGSRVCSLGHLSVETGISISKIRTALAHLESTGDITRQPHKKYTVITLNTYSELFYLADKSQDVDKVLTNESQQYKKIEDKEDNIYILSDAAASENKDFSKSCIPPALYEVQLYAREKGIVTDVRKFWEYYNARGWVTKNGRHITDWRATLRYWADTEKKHASPASQLKPIPKSPSADVYRSLVYNLDE